MPAPLTEPPVLLTKGMAQQMIDDLPSELSDDEKVALLCLVTGATVVVPAHQPAPVAEKLPDEELIEQIAACIPSTVVTAYGLRQAALEILAVIRRTNNGRTNRE